MVLYNDSIILSAVTQWYEWNNGTSNQSVWREWTSSGTAATTTWQVWNDDHAPWGIRYNETIILPAAKIKAMEEERQAAAAAAQATAARAEQLLKENLDALQLEEFKVNKTFTVISRDGERRYRIRKGWAHNVERLDNTGQKMHTLCAHPVDPVPEYDNMLAQKLMLEHDEANFLKIANVGRR